MRLLFTFIGGFLVILPAFSSVGLPTVNISNGGVSARSAFGDAIYEPVSVAPVKRVVSRRANVNNVAYNKKDSGVDVLSPNLPSSNLWAENKVATDAPLRMPNMDEVAVLSNDFDLPDESLDYNFAIDNKSPVTRSQVAHELESTMNRMAEIDAQIAKLSELQRRANNSIKQRGTRKDVAMNKDDDVKISRTVVPMNEPDILIRSVETHKVNKSKNNNQATESLAGLSPSELRKAFRKTFLSENKHLSAMRDTYAAEYDDTVTTSMAGFTTDGNVSDMNSKIRPFEIKVSFRNSDSALSRDNYTLLTTFAGIVVNDPKRAVQVLIPKDATTDAGDRKLTARRLAIIEQVLRDTGIPEQRIMPVLSNREDDGGLVLRNIDSTQYETLTRQQRNQFGKTTTKTYKSMSW